MGKKGKKMQYIVYKGNVRLNKNAKKIQAYDNLQEALVRMESLRILENSQDYYVAEE